MLALYVSPRNKKEKGAVFEELPPIYPVKTLQAMYDEATAERFGFMYVNMLAPEEGYVLQEL